jgi:hypothetical protein
MPTLPPKPVVTSWDVFDTLLARFAPHPHSIFQLIETSQGAQGYVHRRTGAAAALDRIGAPYVLHDIYRQMVADGMSQLDARNLLRTELETERNQLFPIHRNIERFDPTDLIISDMYLSPEQISSILFETCNLHTHRPIIRSNWGKHTGTIWPLVLAAYVVRRHIGDDQNSDIEVPSKFKIVGELVQDSQFTSWERALNELGLDQLALIQRETRLRTIPADAGSFHEAVVGPYFTILACYSMYLVHRFGENAEFAFLSRSSDELCRVFTSMFADIPTRSLDISRRLAGDENMAALFSYGITPATVVVDMVGTGRSFFRFAERNGNPGRTLVLFAFLDAFLSDSERETAERRRTAGRLTNVLAFKEGNIWCLEHLLQAHYPPVSCVGLDRRSGGVVRVFGAAELDRTEMSLAAWKSAAVTEFIRTSRLRGHSFIDIEPCVTAMEKALEAIVRDTKIIKPFSSFAAREVMLDG